MVDIISSIINNTINNNHKGIGLVINQLWDKSELLKIVGTFSFVIKS